jgi:hypothetical protein
MICWLAALQREGGDKYYSYRRMDPFSTTLGMAADYVDLQSHMTEQEKGKTAAILVGSAIQNLSSKTWLSGMSNLGEALGDWARYGDNFLASLAGNAVPDFAAAGAHVVDPVEREASDWLSRIRSRIPLGPRNLPAKRDVFGAEKQGFNAGGLSALSPVLVSQRKRDPIAAAMLEAGVRIDRPKPFVIAAGKRVNMTPEQDTGFQQLAGDNLRLSVAGLMKSPDWGLMNQEERKDDIEKLIAQSRRDAKETLMIGEAPTHRPASNPGTVGIPFWLMDETVKR